MENLKPKIQMLTTRLAAYSPNPSQYPDDEFVHAACKEALGALAEGNYGVGGVLVNPDGEIVTRGHNRMFAPIFRSDLHCEMVILDDFEENNPDTLTMKLYTLYTSLEPCTMCTARLIFSGIGKVVYAAADSFGGQVHLIDSLPPAFRQLSESRPVFKSALCSPLLAEIAFDAFMANRNELFAKLKSR